jgi:FixJ family two-component response regulator
LKTATAHVPNRVVLVEDDAALLAALVFAFEVAGFKVQAFESAEAAAAAEIAPESCLVVDYRLPGRDGLGLIEDLRRRGSAAPTVLMTSAPKPALRARTAAMGVNLVEKPLLWEDMVATVVAMSARRWPDRTA